MEDYILCIALFDLTTASTGDLTYPKVEKKSFQCSTTVLIEHIFEWYACTHLVNGMNVLTVLKIIFITIRVSGLTCC